MSDFISIEEQAKRITLKPGFLERYNKAIAPAFERAAAAEADDRKFLAQVGFSNPWLPRHRNLTSQMRVTRLDKDLADQLQGEAARAK